MMLATYPQRRQAFQQQETSNLLPQSTAWSPASSTPSISQPEYYPTANNRFQFDSGLLEYPPQSYNSSLSQPLMQTESGSQNCWSSNGQLTPTSTRTHNRGSSLSSLGSAGPASPYTPNTSNPQVVGELFSDLSEFQPAISSKPMTPAHTPSQEHFYPSQQYQNIYTPYAVAMGHDGLPRTDADTELMPAPEFNPSTRHSIASGASNDSPSTPPSYEEERGQKNSFPKVPKLERTMTDVYNDNLYSPNYNYTSAPSFSTIAPVHTQNDIFSRRVQEANSQHLSASNTQTPLTIPPRERSPFRHGSPLAPLGNGFGSQQASFRLNTATHMREQQKKVNDERALQRQVERTSPEHSTPQTISPKDVDLVYHEGEDESKMPLFPPAQSQSQNKSYHQQPTLAQEISESDDNMSHQSYRSMATTRRESSSAYSSSSQATPQQNFNFVPPAVPGSVRQAPPTYPFVSRPQQNLKTPAQDFSTTLGTMESNNSDYAPEGSEMQRPPETSADTGTYTCTYHGCTLRFDTPAKLQRHKREGHRNSAVATAGEEGGMTSAAQRNSQAGPHKCERINPSTGKPCNTIFSRPYDLTRHEDTIHNTRKTKVRCGYCREEKTFSRNDALTRHMRVVHPEVAEGGRRRRGGAPHS